MHGAAKTEVRQRAANNVAADQAARTFAALADTSEPVTNPLEALAGLAGDVERWRQFCEQRVNHLEDLRYQGFTAEQVRGEVQLFERAMDRCATVLTAIAKLNIEERLASIEQHQLKLVTEAIHRALVDLGLDEQRQQEANERVAAHLRLVAG